MEYLFPIAIDHENVSGGECSEYRYRSVPACERKSRSRGSAPEQVVESRIRVRASSVGYLFPKVRSASLEQP